MSTFPSTRLKIKSGDGWFAADRSWQSAAQKLSDGAFKLFVYLSLGAERSTGRFVFRQGALVRLEVICTFGQNRRSCFITSMVCGSVVPPNTAPP